MASVTLSALQLEEFAVGAFFLTCSALVLLMVPGLAFFYSGLAQSKSALSQLVVLIAASMLAIIQWYMFGYSLVFDKFTPFIGGVCKYASSTFISEKLTLP